MRPLRLMMEGFGSYRERTEVDLSDVSYFVLTGPTGAGKSTVIDALCFALYGTVPRWGKGNVIRNALAPSTTECRVCLVFEAAGGRYAAARMLRRDPRGNVHTKQARLDRLAGTVAPDVELEKLLDDGPESLVDGPDEMVAAVTRLLGIGYEHFTQCVLLPQGRFAEFLHAKPSDRQDLLIELLAYAVYEQVGSLARERAKIAGAEHDAVSRRLAELGPVSDLQIRAAARRVEQLEALVPEVDAAVEALDELRERWGEVSRLASTSQEQLAGLAALGMPSGVAELATSLAAADESVSQRAAAAEKADEAETAAETLAGSLPPAETLRRWSEGYQRQAVLQADLESRRDRCLRAQTTESELARELAVAEASLTAAETALAATEQAHRAVALAADLHTGEPCPVCRQPVPSLPHHDVPADLNTARAAVKSARSALAAAQTRLNVAAGDLAAARNAVEERERQLAEIVAVLDGAPPQDSVAAALTAREAADKALAEARSAARAARSGVLDAQRRRSSLHDAERAAWSALRAARDRFVTLDAPAVDGLDLAQAWQTLLDWATSRHTELMMSAERLDREVAELRAEGGRASEALRQLLAGHGIELGAARGSGAAGSGAAGRSDGAGRSGAAGKLGTGKLGAAGKSGTAGSAVGEGTVAQQAPAALAAHREGARRDLADLHARRDEAQGLAKDVTRLKQQRDVADKLGLLLRSDGFERWLCASALDSLVIEASETLLRLSGGQYELDRGERNELFVIDHNDAATRRPVNTLSGGETFQASLSLALALSRQVVGLSAGRRSLDSMFLDEGFGTLDESTLDVVASTLEQLAGDTDRVVGVVTHVPALAERIPVQFAVTRNGASSAVRRL